MSVSDMKENVFGAVIMEDAEYLYTLLSQGADPDCRDWSNRTPLHVACYTGSDACVELLIEFGANVSAVDDRNQTPREVAIFHGHQTIAAILDPSKVETLLLNSNTATQYHHHQLQHLQQLENVDSRKFLVSPRSITNSAVAAAAELLDQLSLPSSSGMNVTITGDSVGQNQNNASSSSLQQQQQSLLNPPSSATITQTITQTPPSSISTNNNNNTASPHSIKSIWEKQKHPSAFRAVGDTESVVVCMVGLPGRGKSFLSSHCARFLRWKGVPTRVFNAGDYRRRLLGAEGTHDPSFFDEKNEKAKEQREQMAHFACEDAAKFIKSHPVAVAFIDATNTNRARRKWLLDFFCPNVVPVARILFIESVCDNDEVISQNILRDKVTNGDYKGKPPKEAVESFHKRIEKYRQQYEPIDLEHDEPLSFLRVINLKQTLVANRIQGRLQTLISSFITNLHPVAQSFYLVVPGPYASNQSDTKQQQQENRNMIVKLDDLVTAAKQQFGTDSSSQQQQQTKNSNSNNNSTILTSSNVASNQDLEKLGEQIAYFVKEKINKTKSVLQTGRKRFFQEEIKRRDRRENSNDGGGGGGSASSSTSAKSGKNCNNNTNDQKQQNGGTIKKNNNNNCFNVPSIFDDHDENKFLIAYAEDSSSEKTANAVKNKLAEFHNVERWNVDPRLNQQQRGDDEDDVEDEESDDCEEAQEEDNNNNAREETQDERSEEQREQQSNLSDSKVVETISRLADAQQQKDNQQKQMMMMKPTKIIDTHKNHDERGVKNFSFNSASTFDEKSSIYVHIQIETVQWLQAMSYGLCEGMTVAEAERDYPVTIQFAFQPHTSEPLVREEMSGPDVLLYLQQHNNNSNSSNNDNSNTDKKVQDAVAAPTVDDDSSSSPQSSKPAVTMLSEQEMMKTYVTSYPKGESLRQVAVRVSNMVMQWKRTDSPLLCICSVAPATLLVAFAADLPPECACQLRLPRNTIIEVTAKHALVLRSLLKYANQQEQEQNVDFNEDDDDEQQQEQEGAAKK